MPPPPVGKLSPGCRPPDVANRTKNNGSPAITDNPNYPGLSLTLLAALLALPVWCLCLARGQSAALSTMIATAITLPVTAYAVHAGHVRGITHHITAKDALNQEIAPIITTLCKGHTP